MKDIPKGWVRVSQYDERDDKNGGGPTGNYARILACIKAEPSQIRAYKDGKFWVACKEDIEAFLSTPEQCSEIIATKPAAVHGIEKRHAESVCESLSSIDSTMDEMYRVLERLTSAVESIATQPKTAQQELMATIGGNAFHN